MAAGAALGSFEVGRREAEVILGPEQFRPLRVELFVIFPEPPDPLLGLGVGAQQRRFTAGVERESLPPQQSMLVAFQFCQSISQRFRVTGQPG